MRDRAREKGGDFLRGCNLAPRGAVNKIQRNCPAGTFAFLTNRRSEPIAAVRSGKTAPCRETTLTCYKNTHSLFRAQNNAGHHTDNYTGFFSPLRSPQHPDRAWIITMTLEEISGQDNTMENTDR